MKQKITANTLKLHNTDCRLLAAQLEDCLSYFADLAAAVSLLDSVERSLDHHSLKEPASALALARAKALYESIDSLAGDLDNFNAKFKCVFGFSPEVEDALRNGVME